MQTRRLGRTGHHSTVAILGGIAFHWAGDKGAEGLLQQALDAGVNHLDIAPGYMTAEEVAGRVLTTEVRARLFISEKTQQPTRDGARAELERTLERLHTDRVEVYQLHAVTSIDELDRRAGAVETLQAARDEGLASWLGITGHDYGAPAAHLEALRRYDFDTVMFPITATLWADADYRRDAEALLAECAARDVGVMVIKAGAARPWPADLPPKQRTARTWYEPHHDPGELAAGIRFALSMPGVTAFCTPGDVALFPLALAAAEAATPMDEAEQAALIAARAGEGDLFVALR